MFNSHCAVITALLMLGCTLGGQATASAATFAGASPVSDARLSTLRGGFSTEHGVKLSIGIDQLSFINGKLAVVNHLIQDGLGRVQTIQNGPGNAVNSSVLNGIRDNTLGTVIQNSLDGQAIRNVNVYNVTVTNKRLAQSLSISNAVTDAMTRFMR